MLGVDRQIDSKGCVMFFFFLKFPKAIGFQLFTLVVLCCALIVNFEAQDASASQVNGAGTLVASSGSLKLGPGDLVEMSVYNVPELTTKTRISSNGDMYCPLVGYMHVGGLSAEEAQAAIEKRLSDFVKSPHVSLFVSEYASEGASVLGEVMKPGVYPVMGQQHLFALLSAAGGLTERSGRSLSVTHRSDPNSPVTIDLPRNLADNSETNVAVYPGDVIIVRRADIIYVVGDVLRPSGVLMDSGGLTVLQALAMAGGTGRTAKLGGAKILRKGPGGMVQTPVDLKKILQAKAPDPPMEPNDILVVPSSTGKILAGRTLEAAIQAATLVSVAAIP